MNYQQFQPNDDLQALVKCYWTLEVPAVADPERQRIIPDGCIEMAFILGDDIRRFTSSTDFILQPRAMVIGQITEPFYIQPTGAVNSFAVRFYPYGIANFVKRPIHELANKETPLAELFEEYVATELTQQITRATDTQQRIAVVEAFLLEQLNNQAVVDAIVQTTIDTLLATNGAVHINDLLKEDPSKRRQLERKFVQQIGISPKQLSKVIRLQSALKLLLHQRPASLTQIAYESDYYDQAHFIKDFKEFTGISPKAFLKDNEMALSALFYNSP